MEIMGPINPKFPLPLDSRFYVNSSGSTIGAVLRSKAGDPTSYPFMRVVDIHTGKSWEWQGGDADDWVLFTAKGDKGDKGDSLEFRWDDTRLGVRVQGTSEYQYVDLKGGSGTPGTPGAPGKSIQFNWDGTRLGVRVEGDAEYQYVDLKGPAPTEADYKNLVTTTQFEDTTGGTPDPTQYLYTTAKTIIAAINELKDAIANI